VISRTTAEEALRRDIADLLATEPSPERAAALVEALAYLALEVP
jgi:hypothetical protein